MQVVEREFGAGNAELVRDYYVEVSRLGAEYRLPLLEMAFPALKRREEAALIELAGFTVRLAEIDQDIDLYEFCFAVFCGVISWRLSTHRKPNHTSSTVEPK